MVQQHVVGLSEVFGHWRDAGGEGSTSEGGGREREDGAGGEGGASEADGVATVHAMRRAQAAGSGGELLRHLAASGCGPQQPPVALQPLQVVQPPQGQAGAGGGNGDVPLPAGDGTAAGEARPSPRESGGGRGCCNLNDLLHLLQATHITGADFSPGDASNLFHEVTRLRCEPRVCAANRDSPIVFDTWVRRAMLLGLQPSSATLHAYPRLSHAAPPAVAPQA